MDEHGSIFTKCQSVVIGDTIERRITDYQWYGPPLAAVSWMMVDHESPTRCQVGDRVTIGPFRVQVVEVHYEGWYLVRRLDQFALESWLRARWVNIWSSVEGIGKRCILTLAVWGLSEWPHGEKPSWLHVRRRVRKLLRRKDE